MARSFSMAWPEGAPEGIHDIFQELLNGSDRAVAIVGGALVEELLTRALKYFLRPDATSMEELFSFSGPLGTFSAKIRMGYHLGCYGEEVRRDLDILRRIRNDFAHELQATFSTQVIRDRTASFQLVDRYAADNGTRHPRTGQPPPPNLLDWPTWVFVQDLAATKTDSKERFLAELQALAWAMAASHGRRVSIGRLG